MTTRTSTRLAGLAAALLASLVVVPTALAIPTASSVANGKLVLQQAPSQRGLAPDRVDKLGVLNQGTVAIPDRVDRLGSGRGPQIVQAPGQVSNSGASFGWSVAVFSTGLLLAAALLIMFMVSARGGRRSGGIPLQS